jgi:hypothetical protein
MVCYSYLCALGFSPFWKFYWDMPNLVPALRKLLQTQLLLSSIITALYEKLRVSADIDRYLRALSFYSPHLQKSRP